MFYIKCTFSISYFPFSYYLLNYVEIDSTSFHLLCYTRTPMHIYLYTYGMCNKYCSLNLKWNYCIESYTCIFFSNYPTHRSHSGWPSNVTMRLWGLFEKTNMRFKFEFVLFPMCSIRKPTNSLFNSNETCYQNVLPLINYSNHL